jgi:hypothetical protein
MSNMAQARRLLEEALDCETPHEHIREALKLMYRKQGFKAKGKPSPLTYENKLECRELRRQGMSLHAIGMRFGTNQGIVSFALKELEEE